MDENADKYHGVNLKKVGKKEDALEIASNLYKVLRECDDEGVEYILSESFSDKGIGAAVMNRLIKAAGHKIIDV